MESLSVAETTACAMAAEKIPQRQIAKAVGTSQSNISKITNKHKELIQTQQARLIEGILEKSATRLLTEVEQAGMMNPAGLFDKNNQVALTRIDKKEEMILKSVGIAPSHAPSIHVQQIFNDNRKTILSPNVASLLHGKMNDIIDGEIIEDEANEQD